MGLLALPLVYFLYWLCDKYEKHQADKRYEMYIEEMKRLGLMK